MGFFDVLKSDELGDVIKGVGAVAGAFNPALGKGLILASALVDNVKSLDSDTLKDNVGGLSGTANMLRKMVEQDNFDKDKILMLADNLDSLSSYVEKTSNLIR